MFRPRTLPFPEFMKQASEGTQPPATYTKKFDGFSWKFQRGADGKNVYYTKNSKQPIEVPEERKPKNILEAIVLYIESHGPVLTPNDVLYAGEIPAWELNVEFTAYSLADGTMTDDLQLLYHKKCLDPVTGKLDDTKFGFRINVFDAKFKEEGEAEYRYWTRLESIRDSIHAVNPASNTYYATELYGADDLLQTLAAVRADIATVGLSTDDPDRAMASLQRSQEDLAKAIESARRLITGRRPQALEMWHHFAEQIGKR